MTIMHAPRLIAAPIIASLALAGCVTPEYSRQAAKIQSAQTPVAPAYSVNANDPRAVAAGEEILARGGSATDAAIAVMLALTVVEPQSSGIGGGGFMVRANASGKIETFDGRETAPAAATPRRFLDSDGQVLPPEMRTTSGLSVGVPGNIALAAKAHRRNGRLPWAELFDPAIRLARDGFVMNRRLHSSISQRLNRAGKTDAAKSIYFGPDGDPLAIGSRIRNPALANFLEQTASEGAEALYGAEGAAALADYVAKQTPRDGRLIAKDVTAYSAKQRPPICGKYRTYRLCSMGPPSSGGVAVIQILMQLERFDLAKLGPQSAQFWHLFLESQRLAYADRELYIADSDFIEVPAAGLVDPGYIARRSALIDPERTMEVAEPGVPPSFSAARADGVEPTESGTSHFSVADSEGNVIAYTSTIEGPFGSGLVHRGFYLNNELTDFSFNDEIDGKPVANRVEGGKRPRSSMAPTLVFNEEGAPVLVIGAMGGGTIPVQTARAIIGVLDFGLNVEQAAGLPFAMYFGPQPVVEQSTWLAQNVGELRDLGHPDVRFIPLNYWVTGIKRDGDGWAKGTDPRLAPLIAGTE